MYGGNVDKSAVSGLHFCNPYILILHKITQLSSTVLSSQSPSSQQLKHMNPHVVSCLDNDKTKFMQVNMLQVNNRLPPPPPIVGIRLQ